MKVTHPENRLDSAEEKLENQQENISLNTSSLQRNISQQV